MALEYNFAVDRGASWELIVQYQDSNGAAIPLTGYLITMTIDTPTPTILDNGSHGGIVVDEPNGTMTIQLTNAQTEAFDPASYTWVLEGYLNPTTAPRFLQGQMLVNA